MSPKLKFIALVTIGVFAVMCSGATYLDSLLERFFQEQASELAARSSDGTLPAAGLDNHRLDVLRAVFDLCGILAVAVSAAIYLVFARQVNQRLARLMQVVNAVAQNPAAAERTRDTTGDEVGRLAAAFDQAADSLSKAFASLESKVEKRGLELSATQGSKSAIIEGSLDGIIKADQSGRIVLFNPAAERTFGCRSQAVLGSSLAEIIELDPPTAAGSFAEYLSSMVGQRREMVGLRAGGGRLPIEVAWTRIEAQDPPVYAAFIRDLTEKKRVDDRLHMQLEITQLLAGRPALATCLDQVMEVICRRAGWDVAVLWQLSAEQGKLRCHRILHPTCELDWAFEARLGDLAVPRGMGMAGAVWSDHRPRWRADLRIEPDIDTAAALDGQFRSACCFAISVNGQALGVCQFLSGQPKPVDREMLSLVEGIGASSVCSSIRRRLPHRLSNGNDGSGRLSKPPRKSIGAPTPKARSSKRTRSGSNLPARLRTRPAATAGCRRFAATTCPACRPPSSGPWRRASNCWSSAACAATTGSTACSSCAAFPCAATTAASSNGSARPPTSKTPGAASKPCATVRPN